MTSSNSNSNVYNGELGLSNDQPRELPQNPPFSIPLDAQATQIQAEAEAQVQAAHVKYAAKITNLHTRVAELIGRSMTAHAKFVQELYAAQIVASHDTFAETMAQTFPEIRAETQRPLPESPAPTTPPIHEPRYNGELGWSTDLPRELPQNPPCSIPLDAQAAQLQPQEHHVYGAHVIDATNIANFHIQTVCSEGKVMTDHAEFVQKLFVAQIIVVQNLFEKAMTHAFPGARAAAQAPLQATPTLATPPVHEPRYPNPDGKLNIREDVIDDNPRPIKRANVEHKEVATENEVNHRVPAPDIVQDPK